MSRLEARRIFLRPSFSLIPATVPALLALMLLAGDSAPAHAQEETSRGQKYALLVAVQDYDRKELKPLHYARNDMIEMHQALLNSGFARDNMVLMHDKQPASLLPEVKKIRRQLRLLLETLHADDTLIVAFSGHGVQFRGDERSYFCPLDAELADKDTLLPLDELYRDLKKCRARRKLLLVDACRNDPQSDLSKGRQEVDLESVTRPQKAVPEGIVAVFSCSAGERSWEYDELKHGVFFYHWLTGWKRAGARDGKLDVEEVAAYTVRETEKFARLKLEEVQRPQQRNEFSGAWVLPYAGLAGRENAPPDTSPGKQIAGGLFAEPRGSAYAYRVADADTRERVEKVHKGTLQVAWSRKPGGKIRSIAVDANNEFLYVLTDRAIMKLEVREGKYYWKAPLRNSGETKMVSLANRGTVVVVSTETDKLQFDVHGKRIDAKKEDSRFGEPKGSAYAYRVADADTRERVEKVHKGTLQVVWRNKPGGRIRAITVDAGEQRVALITDQKLIVLDAQDGKSLWSRGNLGELNKVAFANQDREIVVTTETGRTCGFVTRSGLPVPAD